MRQQDIEAVLANQIMMWEQYTEAKWSPGDDQVLCELKPGIMPDGRPCRGMIKAKSRKDAADQWFTYVRAQYDARKNEQEAEASRRAEASRTSRAAEDAAAGVDGGGGEDGETINVGPESSVEDIIKAQVAAIGRSIDVLTAELEKAAAIKQALIAKLERRKRDRAKAIAALKAATRASAADAS